LIKIWYWAILFLLVSGFVWSGGDSTAQTVTVTGDWSLTIGEADLQGGPGSDLNTSYSSSAQQAAIEINGGNYKKNWHVTVERTSWSSNIILSVRRQADTRVSGGLSYIEVPDVGSVPFFFSVNKKDVQNPPIYVQFQLSNVSVSEVEETIYTTTVTYTLIEGQ
jgi:hypothetical protein